MFEQPVKSEKSLLWKIFPLAVVLFAAIVLLVAYLGTSEVKTIEPLTGLVRKGDPDFDWYSKYVSLESRGIQMGKNFAGKRMVMFSGLIDNGGERTLDVVEVKLTLFNFEDPVYEKVVTPIRPGVRTPPIPSLEGRAFTVYLEDIPGEWRASQAEMEINGFRFLAK